MSSVYSEAVKAFVKELNKAFVAHFGLLEEYQHDGILPGDRYGVISTRNLVPNNSKKAGRQVRGGCQFLVFNLDIIFTIGCETRIEIESEASGLLLDIHDGIPRLKESLNSGIFDLQTDENFNASFRQSLGQPHTWIADITCAATADITVFVDEKGFHINPTNQGRYEL